MAESSVYKNGKITNWYEYTVSRFNTLLGMYTDKSIPDEFFEFKGKYMLKGTEKLREEGLEKVASSIEKMYKTLLSRKKNIWPVQAEEEHEQGAHDGKRVRAFNF